MEKQSHELANLFPMMNDAELSMLIDDMSANGYDASSPIVLFEGKILDGRNRYKAADAVGVAPVFVSFKDGDPLAYVLRHNLHRRHLNETQRAGIAAKIANMERTDTLKQNRSANLPIGKVTQAKAAKDLNVSERTIRTFKAVAEAMPELVEKMESGEMSAHEADKKVKEIQRLDERKKIAQKGQAVKTSDKWEVHWNTIEKIELKKQFDFIITDPPYPKEFLPLYETLAIRSNEWLKDGGLLVAMCGQSYLNEIYAMMSKHLAYYWTAAYLTPGQAASMRQVNVNPQWKPLLIFRKGEYKGKIFGDVLVSDGNDKSMHKWGQSESGMYSIISKMCLEGQSILDPFCGAGTTGIAALKHGCFFEGVEKEKENVEISHGRLSEL